MMISNHETITKRKDGRFMGRFIVGHKENGKAVYQYVYGSTYEEAEKKLRIGREIENMYLSGRNITVKEIYDAWLPAVANRIKESTYANYRLKFEKHILPAFGDMICSSLTAADINSFIRTKLESGLSPGYIRDLYTVFKSLLKYAEEEYSFKLSLKNVVLPKKEKPKVKRITDEQQKRLVRYVKANFDITGLGVLLSLFTGIRIGELCGLKWKDIDTERKIVYVNQTVQRICKEKGGRKTTVIVSAPKSECSKRCIAIPDFLIPYINQFKGEADHYLISGSVKPAEPRTVQYRFRKLLDSAETDAVNFHQLRHYFASSCIKNGFDVKTVSMALGHSSVSITLNRYVHTDIQYERKMINSLSKYI